MSCNKTRKLGIAIGVAVMSQGVSAAPLPSIESQSDAKGLIEDSHLDVLLRSYYLNRDRKNGAHDFRDWTLGIQGTFASGFTQGPVGFGVDALAYSGTRLWGPDRYAGDGALQLNHRADGTVDNQPSYGKAGAALKMRVSKTQVKVGEMRVGNSPIFAVGGLRLTPQTATGINVMSREIDNLYLEGGHFWSGSSEATTSGDGDLFAAYAFVRSRKIDYFGGRYIFGKSLSASLYTSRLEDVWNQYYANLNYTMALNDNQALNFDANLYRTLDEGEAKAGPINNTALSLAATYDVGFHSFILGYQKIHGDTPFDYVGFGDGRGSDSNYMSNSAQFSDYNGPNETSWRAEYNYSFGGYGWPGLTAGARYVWGYGVDGTHISDKSVYRSSDGAPLYGEDGRHHEVDLDLRYVVQSGVAKDLSLRARGVVHSSNQDQGEGDLKQIRLIADYPISIF